MGLWREAKKTFSRVERRCCTYESASTNQWAYGQRLVERNFDATSTVTILLLIRGYLAQMMMYPNVDEDLLKVEDSVNHAFLVNCRLLGLQARSSLDARGRHRVAREPRMAKLRVA